LGEGGWGAGKGVTAGIRVPVSVLYAGTPRVPGRKKKARESDRDFAKRQSHRGAAASGKPGRKNGFPTKAKRGKRTGDWGERRPLNLKSPGTKRGRSQNLVKKKRKGGSSNNGKRAQPRAEDHTA